MNLTGSIEEKRHFNASSIGHTVQVSYIVLRVQPTFRTSPSVLSLVVWRSWIIESSTVSHMAIYTLAVSMNVRVKGPCTFRPFVRRRHSKTNCHSWKSIFHYSFWNFSSKTKSGSRLPISVLASKSNSRS